MNVSHLVCSFFLVPLWVDVIRCGSAPGSHATDCPFLEMEDDPEKSNACTTAFFEGQAAVMDPRESWVAKWLRVDNYLPGVYAITVTGQFEREVEEELENRGCRWRCKPAS